MKTSLGTAVPAVPPRARRRPFGTLREGIHDLTSRMRLIRFLVGAEMKRTHADTAIGMLWWILDPVLQMFVYWMLVAVIFQRTTPDILLFLMSAILPWKWLASTLSEASTSITSRQSLIRQLQFPKLVLPTAASVAALVSFAFGLVALAFLYLIYPHRLSHWIVALPAIAVVQFVFTLALGVLLSALNAFFRDVQNILRHIIRLWMYVSPVLYSLQQIEGQDTARQILGLNPMAPIIESYRLVLYGTEKSGHGIQPEWLPLLAVLGLSLILLAIAIVLFKRAEPSFARILA
ncbi:MAG: ABC transporter permease [Chloroflexi bacterium]|nr:ABC transporter permease [Chloroflexota bacterium]